MRFAWVGLYIVAVLGATVATAVALRSHNGTWLFFAAQGLGAGLAGVAVARQSPPRTLAEPAIGGLGAAIMLVTVGAVHVRSVGENPRTWLMIALTVLLAIAMTTGGAALGRGRNPGAVAIAGLSMFVVMGLVTIVMAIVTLADLDLRSTAVVVAALVVAVLGAGITQLAAPYQARLECGLGVPLLIVVDLAASAISGKAVKSELVVGAALMLIPGMVGATIGWRVKPKRLDPPDAATAFD